MPVLGTGGINRILGAAFGQTATIPDTLYLALYSVAITAPTASGGTEFATASYVRATVTNDDTVFGAVSGGLVTNVGSITFTEALEDWGTAANAALWMDPTSILAADLYVVCGLVTPKTILSGNTAQVEPGILVIGGG